MSQENRTYIKAGDIEITVSQGNLTAEKRNKLALELFNRICDEVIKRKNKVMGK